MINRLHEIQRQRAAGELDASGFTLIELLIVIVVLGILAAVVVFALGGVTGQSIVSACNADAKTVQVAVAAYEAQGGTAASVTPTVLTQNNPGIGGPYLQSFPANTGSDYAIVIGQAQGDAPDQVDVELGGTWSNANPPVYGGTFTTTDYSATACANATT